MIKKLIKSLKKETYNIRLPDNRNRKSKQTRRKPTFIVFLNIILLLIMSYIYLKKTPEQSYASTSFSRNGIDFRISMSREKEFGNVMLLMSIKSSKKQKIFFQGKIADASLDFKNEIILKQIIGAGISEIDFQENEVITKSELIDNKNFTNFFKNHTGLEKRWNNPLSLLDKRTVPITTTITIYLPETEKKSFIFNYEVSR